MHGHRTVESSPNRPRSAQNGRVMYQSFPLIPDHLAPLLGGPDKAVNSSHAAGSSVRPVIAISSGL
jgi:hypothetical protein